MDVKGYSAIVTGGASGLGEATARKLHELGAKLVIADVSERGQEVAESLGEGARFVRTDVTDPESVRATVAAAKELGPLGVTVNCAGIAIAEKVLGKQGPHDLDAFARVIHVNLIGTFNVLRLAAEAMSQGEPNEDGERGVIINTASVAAFEGQIGQVAYSASKGGVVGLTLPAARDLARYGIRVVSIAPGIFDTRMLAGLPEPARKSLGQQVPFPSRLGRPEEYAMLVASIVGNAMINGTTIRLDGAIRMAPR
ncbi:3-hydroxyacyl-CoA dehydrogenase [Kyrpidia tusciae]|uniref:Short-chain dehydrogenase/reductase SDR n=1 Tax=Kyrpidia tusciae (strain DSM 2912 / NBRC 15312 / T2) TaxID=562970 RepID=D5WWF8_KYRT2|nr:3-hydroxyacyl-CoA dehydrogenase [Kyrpidia tusciae]ADG07723.1 short-chain dehydrogenase/reductase SDR [Kyrpidia tusciae DSM 2912]